MSLLQISEPGLSPDPHQHRITIGIDLGTTNSLVAAVHHGVAECLPDSNGRTLLPSVVHYDKSGSIEIGSSAQCLQEEDPANTIVSVKRFMGRSLADIHEQASLPYTLIVDQNIVALQTVQGNKTPIEVSADILRALKKRAESTFHDELYGAVITVPAYFDDAQRQATKDAAKLAGLTVLRLINEPTAAAISYGLDHASEGIYAVYDLGGGTFDVSILRLSQGVFEVIATGGDSYLGGDDWDQCLMKHFIQVLAITHMDAFALATLRTVARATKEALTKNDSHIARFRLAGKAYETMVTRMQFETMTASLLQKTMSIQQSVLQDVKLTRQDIKGVVLVGGSTRMPQVRQAVHQFFGREPLTNLNPDEVVALGAAISANQLAGNDPNGEILLLDVLPLSLGIETMGGLVERIIPRNQTIPISMAQDFTTYADGQSAMSIHVVQGERDLVQHCRSLAHFDLAGLPPLPAGIARVRITFIVDADGLLQVSAREEHTGVEARIAVKPSYGLDDEAITRMLKESFKTAKIDLQTRNLIEAKVDGQRLIDATHAALWADRDLLEKVEQLNIENALSELTECLTGHDVDAISAMNKKLSAVTESFAERRMNRSLAKALTGQHIGGAS